MKPLRATAPVFCSALIALCFAACGTGAASDDSDNPELDSRLIGTWTRSYSVDITDEDDDDEDGNYLEVIGTYTSEGAFRFDSDGSYYSVSNDTEDYIPSWSYEDDEFESDADKGTYSIESEGVISTTQQYDYEGTTPLTLSTVIPDSAWILDGETSIQPYALIDGALYIGPWTRSGSGSGLVGTWELYWATTSGESSIVHIKSKSVITDSTITEYTYLKNAAGDYDLSDTDSYDYWPDDSNPDRVIVRDADEEEYYMEYALKGGYLLIGSSVYGLIKD